MNIIKKSLIIAAMGAALSSSSYAITTGNSVVYITGSTGFRGTINTWFASQAGGSGYSNNLVAWDGGTSNSLANFAAAKNLAYTNIPVTVNGTPTNVDVVFAFGGSEAGIQATFAPTNNPKQLSFYNIGALTSATGMTNTVAAGSDVYHTNANTSFQTPTMTFSDTSQAASYFQGGTMSQDGVTYLKCNVAAGVTGGASGTGGQKIAVLPFGFYASKNAPFTNLSSGAWYDILTTVGGVPMSELTGSTNDDTTNSIYLQPVGRNVDSGTRMNMQAMAHIPKTVNFQQVKPTASGGLITAINLETNATINGISQLAGNNGESSGGTVAGFLTNDGTSYGTYLVGYIALADSVAKYPGGIVPLTYNGVQGRAYSVASTTNPSINPAWSNAALGGSIGGIGYLDQGYTNIITGAYPYWGYEHVMYNTNTASNATVAGATVALYNSFVSTNNGIRSLSSTNTFMYGGIKLEDMQIQRSGTTVDGGPVAPNAALQ